MGDLYRDAPNPDGYQAATGRPVSSKEEPYRVVRLGDKPVRRDLIVLFQIKDGDGWYDGCISDPVPAKHYAQMLLDAVEVGPMVAQAAMLNNVLGAENMRRLAECDDLGPDDLVTIMSQVAARVMGPYKAMEDALKNG